MSVNPKVSLVFDGITDEAPVGGNNVVGFAPNDTSYVVRYPLSGQYVTSFNLVLSNHNGWDWKPCDPPDAPCDEYASEKVLDLEAVLTHEWGHVLGLVHVEDQELTMNPDNGGRVGFIDRRRVSLGLGDVLGVRSLYPCSCPLPPIHNP